MGGGGRGRGKNWYSYSHSLDGGGGGVLFSRIISVIFLCAKVTCMDLEINHSHRLLVVVGVIRHQPQSSRCD